MTDQVDELKNIFSDFKILAAKVKDDNRIKRKNLIKQKNYQKYVKKYIKNYILNMKISEKNMIIWYHNIIGQERKTN